VGTAKYLSSCAENIVEYVLGRRSSGRFRNDDHCLSGNPSFLRCGTGGAVDFGIRIFSKQRTICYYYAPIYGVVSCPDRFLSFVLG